MMAFSAPLPIDAVLHDVRAALARHSAAVLIAPPGAGKTTRVPLALMDEAWLAGKKILVLEPRRMAARAAAERMAQTLSEQVGERIGLRARTLSKTGPKTRIEVITEGVFTRMILDDPALTGIGAVLFDEFHERSLDADMGLALALDCQKGLRNDMRIMPMSATLDGARVATLLGEAPMITSEGRAFPVETRYLGRNAALRLEDQMASAIQHALRVETGSILAFFPGQAEIRRTHEKLREHIRDSSVHIVPLYGAIDSREQDAALKPAASGTRKIVLATSIAETSITIEGVRVVIDSGLARVPRFEADVGVTRLETVRVSRAGAEQRKGRAGRMEAGVCYRLWDEAETQSLPAFAEPEMRSADLSGLVLDCAAWGVTDPAQLAWIDPPAPAAVKAAREELRQLDALDENSHITTAGKQLRALPLPPRLGRMVLAAAAMGHAKSAADIAALLVERGLGGTSPDLEERLSAFQKDGSPRARDMKRMAAGWAHMAEQMNSGHAAAEGINPARLLALAFPERLAKARGVGGQFLLANGRGAMVDTVHRLANSPFLVVAELAGSASSTRILLAAAADEAAILAAGAEHITENTEIFFDAATAAVKARRTRRLHALVLSSEPLAVQAGDETATMLAMGIASIGIEKLPWNKAQHQLRHRIHFLRATGAQDWPDCSNEALAQNAGNWLAPYLTRITKLSDITSDDLQNALDALLPWAMKQRLDEEAPTHFIAPTGNHHMIDYDGEGAPALSIRVQELFGLTQHPSIANGKLPLTLHLLSPAQRPIQVTRDLPGFWKGSWANVKAEMKGRYPRHVWPDDPATALPTHRAKPRGT